MCLTLSVSLRHMFESQGLLQTRLPLSALTPSSEARSAADVLLHSRADRREMGRPVLWLTMGALCCLEKGPGCSMGRLGPTGLFPGRRGPCVGAERVDCREEVRSE